MKISDEEKMLYERKLSYLSFEKDLIMISMKLSNQEKAIQENKKNTLNTFENISNNFKELKISSDSEISHLDQSISKLHDKIDDRTSKNIKVIYWILCSSISGMGGIIFFLASYIFKTLHD
jgi:hypothetical protein